MKIGASKYMANDGHIASTHQSLCAPPKPCQQSLQPSAASPLTKVVLRPVTQGTASSAER